MEWVYREYWKENLRIHIIKEENLQADSIFRDLEILIIKANVLIISGDLDIKEVLDVPKGQSNAAPGIALKEDILKPGPYQFSITCFGELLPYHENKMFLNFDKKDQHGMPIITFDAKLRDNEMALRQDGIQCGIEMLEAAGCTHVTSYDSPTAVGAAIHEMGTARMGRDPKTSVLNKWNQIHDVPNVFVTDGSCMTSSATQNPSLTYMALTARAVDYAHGRMKQDEL